MATAPATRLRGTGKNSGLVKLFRGENGVTFKSEAFVTRKKGSKLAVRESSIEISGIFWLILL